jgi:hypothetical protein
MVVAHWLLGFNDPGVLGALEGAGLRCTRRERSPQGVDDRQPR